jgi:Ser/Thr protein kinase RdoA (MazF antagonist)
MEGHGAVVDRAARAAVAAAAGQGVTSSAPVVVRDATNVLVHLAPAPVVARVSLTLARLRPPAWFAQEVELAAYLADRGAPVAPPARDVDPGPHRSEGFLVSLWTYVEHDRARFDAGAAGRSLRELHDALAEFPGELPSCDRSEQVGRLLALLRPSPLVSAEQLAGLRHVHARLSAAPRSAGRPLHGDSHFGNILWSAHGPLWTDLENACSGPVEYDLACLAWRGAAGTDRALAAFGAYDPFEVRRLTPLLALFLAAWTVVVVERVSSPGAIANARRRIDYALEM